MGAIPRAFGGSDRSYRSADCARAIPSAPRPEVSWDASQVKQELVQDHSDEARRACTDSARVSRADVVISMSMQASVTDCP